MGEFILSLAGLAHLVAWIWVVVLGFRTSIIWGLVTLLCPGLGVIIFIVATWDKAKQPAMLLIVAWILSTIAWTMGAVRY